MGGQWFQHHTFQSIFDIPNIEKVIKEDQLLYPYSWIREDTFLFNFNSKSKRQTWFKNIILPKEHYFCIFKMYLKIIFLKGFPYGKRHHDPLPWRQYTTASYGNGGGGPVWDILDIHKANDALERNH